MFLRIGPMGLLLVLLFVLNAGATQYPLNQKKDPLLIHQTSPPLFKDVAAMWLYVVNERQITKMALSKKTLAESSIISIDGYVNGVVLLSTASMNVSIDHQIMTPIRNDKEGYFQLQNSHRLSRDDFWATFLPLDSENVTPDRIKGCYSSFTEIPGDILSATREFQITMDQPGIQNHLTVRQNAPLKLQEENLVPVENNGPDVYYLGNDAKGFEKSGPAFEKRLKAILSGVSRIENNVGSKIVDQIRILDFDGPHNAYTSEKKNVIWLYSHVFWGEDEQELKIIAEHETLHIVSNQMGLPTSGPIRNFFAELKGYTSLSWGRFQIVMTGQPPKNEIPSDAGCLFDFINERNFIQGAKGGHSQDNLGEFCASFLHTLIYLDQLEHRFHTPIRLSDGSLLTLSTDKKNRLLKEYGALLKMVTDGVTIRSSAKWHTFFQVCRERICRLTEPAIPVESPALPGS